MTRLSETSPDVASGVPGAVRPRGTARAVRSLRAKAGWALLSLVIFLGGSALFVSVERSQLDTQLQGLQAVSRHERALALTLAAVETARLDASEDLSRVHPLSPAEARAAALHGAARAAPPDLDAYMDNCEQLFAELRPWEAGYALLYRQVESSWHELKTAPSDAAWQGLRTALADVQAELRLRHDRLVAQRETEAQVYQRQFDAVTAETGLLAVAGLLLMGVPVLLFAGRLARDIGRLEAHARGLVSGRRGAPLVVTRHDEVGALMASVNQLAEDLATRERALAADRERRAHDDKMHALAALAAGVAHEINNPLAVIAGLADQLSDAHADAAADPQAALAAAREIVRQTRRAAIAAQRLTQAATPLPGDLRWLDLAELLGQAVALTGHDRRFGHLAVEVRADPDLSAVHLGAARVQQLLMQLLQVAAELLVGTVEGTVEGTVRRSPEPVRIVLDGEPGDATRVRLRLWLPPVDGGGTVTVTGTGTGAGAEQALTWAACAASAETLGGTLAFAQDAASVPCITLRLPVDGVLPEGAHAE